VSPTITDELPVELPDVRAGLLPPRYGYRMQDVFRVRLAPALHEGARILDVGAGRAPTLAIDDRPAGSWYVGLDSSAEELAAAPPGSYDEAIVHDITKPLGRDQEFDVAISWQVLEHVESVPAALQSLRSALRVGGTLVAQLSGRYALFAIAARLMPHRARVRVLSRLLHEPMQEKFPTRYDRCWAAALERLLTPWAEYELVSFYRGASYLTPLRPIQRAYLVYESALARRDARNFATHYLIIAKR
jgi:2-polyprenyl-6-hydroxyphenyl methylase/3-demethylubiquinone-9 3-methyltransferase